MLSPMNSPTVAHEDHLRRLLDLRTARAELHGRIPSVSEFTDTPSLYSNAFFSPRPMDKTAELEFDSMPYENPPVSDTRSNRQLLNDPAVSIVDFDDTSRDSLSTPHPFSDDLNSSQTEEESEDALDESESRMSILGPKMRFHSRAPWETGEDALVEEEETEDTRGRNVFSRGEVIMKGLGLGSRPSSAGRRSGESNRSQGKPKTSHEHTSSQPASPHNALHALAQASLPISHAPLSYGVARNNISTARGPPHMPNSPDSIPSPHSPSPRSMSHPYSPQSPSTSSSTANANTSLPELHPYANPSLAMSASQESEPTTPLHPAFVVHGALQSTSTLSLSRSATTSNALSKPSGPTSPDRHAPHHSREQTLGRISTLNGKEISSPIAVLRSPFKDNSCGPSPLNGHSGWHDPPPSPSLTLISLEEARALRSRSASIHPVIPSQSKDFSKHGTYYEQGPDARTPKYGLSRQNSNSSRTRVRSISAGAKAKAALHTLVTGSTSSKNDSDRSLDEYPNPYAPNGAPPEKPRVRHKKSGIMRLFNSKDKDREKDKSPAPPVPVFPEVHAAHRLSPPHKAFMLNPLRKPSPHRVPVPNAATFPVPGPYNPQSHRASDSEEVLDISSAFTPSVITPASKRTPPRQLSINTSQPRSFMSASSIDLLQSPYDSLASASLLDPGSSWLPTQSAPPITKDFKLSLRPVSGMFSSHFKEHLVDPPSASTLASDESFVPLASPEEHSVPITPMSSTRSIPSRNVGSSSPEDASAVINALQSQILTAKKAWQREIWELECQVKELKAEVGNLRAGDGGQGYCETCGRGKRPTVTPDSDISDGKGGVVNRPRARTGTGTSRFAGGI